MSTHLLNGTCSLITNQHSGKLVGCGYRPNAFYKKHYIINGEGFQLMNLVVSGVHSVPILTKSAAPTGTSTAAAPQAPNSES